MCIVLKVRLLFQIKGDGDCFFSAALAQIEFVTENCSKRYSPIYLQLLLHFIKEVDVLEDMVVKELKENYGMPDSQEKEDDPGPFSIANYVMYMAQDKVWADSICIKLLASMWGCRITVLRSDSCKEIRFRHDKGLKDSDFIFIYNCESDGGHFSTALRVNKIRMKASKLVRIRNFNVEEDMEEREGRGEGVVLGKDYVAVNKEKLRVLKYKAMKYDKIKEFVDDSSGVAATTLDLSSVRSSVSTSQPRISSIRGKEEEPNIQVVGEEDVKCNKCQKEFKSTAELKQHIDVKHKDIYSFVCRVCNKGFTSRVGYSKHKLQHKPKSEIEKLPKEVVPEKGKKSTGVNVCKNEGHEPIYFMSVQAFKKHMKEKHINLKFTSAQVVGRNLAPKVI